MIGFAKFTAMLYVAPSKLHRYCKFPSQVLIQQWNPLICSLCLVPSLINNCVIVTNALWGVQHWTWNRYVVISAGVRNNLRHLTSPLLALVTVMQLLISDGANFFGVSHEKHQSDFDWAISTAVSLRYYTVLIPASVFIFSRISSLCLWVCANVKPGRNVRSLLNKGNGCSGAAVIL